MIATTKSRDRQRLLIAILLWFGAQLGSGLKAQVNTETVMSIGKNALYFNDYVLAIQYFNLVIGAKPYLYQPWFYRGLAKFYLEDYTGAEKDFNKTIEINPYFSDTYQLRGLCRINMREYNDAANDFRKALETEPNNKGFVHNIVYCFIELDSLDQAKLEADTLLTRWPDYTDGMILMANIKLKQKKWEDVDSCTDVILKKDSTNSSALRLKAGYYIEMKEWDKAIQSLDKVLAKSPKSTNTLNLKANIQLYNKRWEDAEKTLNLSLELQPHDVRNLMNRAICYYYLEDLRKQMADYNTILELDPENFFAHYNRGQLRSYVGDDNLAIEDFDYIISQDPNDMMAVFNRAMLRDKTGDYKGAIRDYTTIIKNFPKFTQGYYLRAEARKKIGDRKGAIKDEEHYLKESIAHQYGYSTPTSQMKDKTMRRRSDVDFDNYEQLVADEESEKEPELDEQEQTYKSEYRGKVQNKKVEVKLLAEINDDMKELHPEAVALYNRACREAGLGHPDEAMQHFTEAIGLRKDFGEAYYNRGVLHILKDEIKEGIDDLSLAGQLGLYTAYSIIKQFQKKK